MALADTAKLIVDLNLKGNFGSQLSKTQRALNTFDSRLDRTESRAYRFGQQIGTGIRRAATLAAGGLAFLAGNVAVGLNSLIDLEQQVAQTNAVLKSTRGAARVGANGVSRLAEEFENLNALIGDEFIRSAQNMLLTFTNIKGKAFKPTLQAVLDLNTALGRGEGGLTQTALQVGKALQDPVKGITALRRAGVSFTAAQIKKIKSLVKEGKLYEAQTLILRELNKEFGGSFAAQGRTTAGRIAKFRDSIEDLQRALAKALLPTLGNVADALSKVLADPKVIASVESFGKDLAGLFSEANLTKGAKVLGDFLNAAKEAAPGIIAGAKIAGQVVATAVRLFQSLPPDIQKLAIGAFAINKLTGGLVTNLAGGLISSVLKQLVSGIVNVRGGVVNVVGGAGGIGAAGGVAKGLTGVQKMFLVGEAIGLATLVFSVQQGLSEQSSAIATGLQETQSAFLKQKPTPEALRSALAGVEQGIADLKSNPLNVLVQGDALTKLEAMRAELLAQGAQRPTSAKDLAGLTDLKQSFLERQGEVVGGLTDLKQSFLENKLAVNNLRPGIDHILPQAVATGATNVGTAVATSGTQTRSTVAASANANAARVVGATQSQTATLVATIWAARPIVNVTNVTKTTTIQNRYGPSNGSYGTEAGK